MNSTYHLFVSLGKSIIRTVACILLLHLKIEIAAVILIIAEIFGIIEELVDDR